MNDSDVMNILDRAHYTDIKYVDGVYTAVNVLGEKRIFRFKQMLSSPIKVYAIKAVNVDFLEFDNIADIKALGLNFEELDDNGNIKHIIKVVDYFLNVTEEQSNIIKSIYDSIE